MASPYDYRWQRFRVGKLKREPLCAYCLELGVTKTATEVHHVIPVRERLDLRLSDGNTISLCKRCHDSTAQREERIGHRRGCGVDGVPRDAKHFWRSDDR